MKTLHFIPTEFLHFQKIASMFNISFSSMVEKGVVVVEANTDELEIIGY